MMSRECAAGDTSFGGVAVLSRVLLALGVAFALLIAVLGGQARGAAAWLPDQALEADDPGTGLDYSYVYSPDIAMDSRGYAYAVWNDFAPTATTARAAVHPPGSVWNDPVTLQSATTENLHVSAGDNGAAVAVWQNDEEAAVYATVREPGGGDSGGPGGGWNRPISLSTVAGATTPRIAVDDDGDAIAVWQQGSDIIMASNRPAGGAPLDPRDGWTDPVPLSTSGATAVEPQVGVDAHGDAVAAWLEGSSGNHVVKVKERSRDTGAWGTATSLSTSGSSEMQLAVGDDGTAAAIWLQAPANSIQAYVRPAGDQWPASPAPELLASSLTVFVSALPLPRVAVDAAGNVFAVWREDGKSQKTVEIQADVRPAGPGKTFESPPTGISARDVEPKPGEPESGEKWSAAYDPRVAAAGNGKAVAVWEMGSSGVPIPRTIGAAVLDMASGHGWERMSEALAPAGAEDGAREPRVAVDAEGNGIAVWEDRSDPINRRSRFATYDAAGPRLDGLSIPAEATVGEPASFAVAPVDVWWTVGDEDISWDFDDGDTADGGAVSHTFATDGQHTVYVTATDFLGNETETSGTVSVRQPAPSPLPPGPGPAPTPPSPAIPPPPGPAIPLPPSTGSRPQVQITGATATVSRTGSTSLALTCAAGSSKPCEGTVTLKTAGKVKQGKRKQVVTLGSAGYSLAAGKSGSIRVRLSKAGKRLVRRLGKVRVTIVATVRDAAATTTATRTVVLRARR